MARSKSSKRSERDPLEIAIGPMLGPLSPSPLVSPLLPSPLVLSEIEDGRQFHPEFDSRPALTIGGSPTRTVARGKPARLFNVSHRLGFDQPVHVVRCVRRKQRREVLFAKRRTRKGSGARRHRNQWSNVHCK